MSTPVEIFPARAAEAAYQVDALFFFMTIVTGLAALGVFTMLAYFSVRYRRRTPPVATPRIEGALSLELFWTITPFLIFLVMFWWGARIYLSMSQPPAGAIDVYVVGKQWMWKVQHAEGQREINELHVPLGQPVKLTLTSEDVIHDFFVPAFRTKIDVIPGRYVYEWFKPTLVGTYHIFCSQYCGTNHAGMRGELYVMDPADYQQWLNLKAEGSLALEGRKLFLQLQCITCHVAGPKARAPILESLYGATIPLRGGGTKLADDNYIRESILNPQAKVVLGWEPIMPTFEGQVSEEDLIKLIAYIKSLGPGQTPQRNEESVPPPPPPAKAAEKTESP
ncbi:MAG TPA: cytochrome c oxidase subunit II [Lacipirellulaceae bacterium]|jgi:cytochrome c oxidase subunit 2|nr:cytochrome c oxidase subunit II [Lacipirellulaceae bacterium]